MAQIFLSVDEVVANARTLLKSDVDGVTEVFLRQWAYLAQRQIGVTKNNIKTEEIPINEFAVRKPDDFVLADDMGLYDTENNELTYVYEKMGGTSYLSTHSPRLHIGLGNASQADEIEILWPGGGRQKLENVSANRRLTVDEPE